MLISQNNTKKGCFFIGAKNHYFENPHLFQHFPTNGGGHGRGPHPNHHDAAEHEQEGEVSVPGALRHANPRGLWGQKKLGNVDPPRINKTPSETLQNHPGCKKRYHPFGSSWLVCKCLQQASPLLQLDR